MSDLVEYPQGSEFPGVIGRTVQESSPAWPAPSRAKDGRAERAVLRARRRRLRAAQLLRRPGRDAEHRSRRGLGPALREHAHDRAVLAHAREHPDRPQPPLQRRRLHPGAGHRLSRLRRADAGRERDAARDAGARGLQHVLPRQVAPVAVGGEHAGRPVPPLAARPRLRALLRLPRRRDQPVVSGPDARQQPDAASRRAPRRATTSARTSPTRRSRWCSTRTSTRPRSRSSCTTRRAAAHAPHHVPKEWADRFKGTFDGGWDAYRETVFANQKRDRAAAGADAQLSPRDPDVPEWSTLSADERRLYARMMEVFAGFVVARRPPLRADPRHARADRRAREHADHGHLRQRRVGRGRRHRLVQRDALLQPGAGELRGQPGAHRRPRRPVVLQPLRVGLGVGRRHAVPALEARDLPRRLDRPVRPRLAGRDGGARRDPHAVRARRSTWCRPCSTRSASSRRRRSSGVPQTPLEGVSFAHTFDDADAASKHVTQYFEMFGHRAIYHDGWRAVCPWPARELHGGGEARAQARRSRSRPRSWTSSTAAAGSSTAWPTTRASRTDIAAEHPDVLRDLIARWWEEAEKYKVLPLDGVDAGAARDGAPADLQAADPLRLLPGRLGRARVRGAAGLQPRVLDRGRRRDPGRAAPRACCWPRAATPAATPST